VMLWKGFKVCMAIGYQQFLNSKRCSINNRQIKLICAFLFCHRAHLRA
jgi:hypothetical protein